jgi:glycosyltransferase involved in cell wall biosynthesis
MKEDYINKYPWVQQKSHVLYWGFNEEAFKNLFPRTAKDIVAKTSSEEVLLHAGNIFDYQNPKVLWKLIKNMSERGRKIKIKFIGTVGPAIKKSIEEAGLNNSVEYMGFLAYQDMLKELFKADYLMVCASEPRHVPGKLFEYLRTGKPILAFGDGNDEVKNILSEANAGMLFSYSEDGHEFFENVAKVKTDISSLNNYNRKNIAERLAEILKG